MNPNDGGTTSDVVLGFATLTPTYRVILTEPGKFIIRGSMGFLLLLLVIAAVAAAYFWFRKKTAVMAEPLPVSNRFHAVTIQLGQGACLAVQALAKTKFLAKEAPRLPLDECTLPACQCEYQHYDDRRDHKGRRVEHAGVIDEGVQRRRAREDRRKSNL